MDALNKHIVSLYGYIKLKSFSCYLWVPRGYQLANTGDIVNSKSNTGQGIYIYTYSVGYCGYTFLNIAEASNSIQSNYPLTSNLNRLDSNPELSGF